LYEFHAS
jgi:hypothetical protein